MLSYCRPPLAPTRGSRAEAFSFGRELALAVLWMQTQLQHMHALEVTHARPLHFVKATRLTQDDC